MPLTRLSHVALDRMGEARDGAAREIANFARTDTLCHRAEDPALAERQAALWGAWLNWAERALDAPLNAADSILPLTQPDASIAALEARAKALDDFRLTGLVSAAAVLGSAVLAFALLEAEIGAEEAFEVSRLEEVFQNERWGEDAEAAVAAAGKVRDLLAVETMLRMLDEAGV